MDLEVQQRNSYKNLRRCAECRQLALERITSPIGWLFCISCWWICGLGCCCLCCCRQEYCSVCEVEAFYEKAKERRIRWMEDVSLYSQPSFDEAVKEEQTELLLTKKKDK